MIPPSEQSNFETFRDCLSDVLISSLRAPPKPSRRRAKAGRKNGARNKSQEVVDAPQHGEEGSGEDADAEELGEFIDYLATEIFTSLPPDLRTLSYSAVHDPSSPTAQKYSTPLPSSTLDAILSALPPSVADSLTAYALIPTTSDSPSTTTSTTTASSLPPFLTPPLTTYITHLTTPPPTTRASKPASNTCEICARTWVPLTYHHLTPRSVAAKAVRRGWCAAWEVGRGAWLCRACHGFVHRIAGNEELARCWGSVGLLLGREDVRRWGEWVGGVRWRKR